jgi:hypothetical protein
VRFTARARRDASVGVGVAAGVAQKENRQEGPPEQRPATRRGKQQLQAHARHDCRERATTWALWRSRFAPIASRDKHGGARSTTYPPRSGRRDHRVGVQRPPGRGAAAAAMASSSCFPVARDGSEEILSRSDGYTPLTPERLHGVVNAYLPPLYWLGVRKAAAATRSATTTSGLNPRRLDFSFPGQHRAAEVFPRAPPTFVLSQTSSCPSSGQRHPHHHCPQLARKAARLAPFHAGQNLPYLAQLVVRTGDGATFIELMKRKEHPAPATRGGAHHHLGLEYND